ncbi:MAG: tetratricopeptide repeat protein [Chromatiales bacterium]|nr:tetratricopeptide repeat protein [Chromatiales bacterium]
MLVSACATAQADQASELPDATHPQVVALAEPDIQGAEPVMQAAIGDARKRLNAALAAPVDAKRLAEAFGELAALYHNVGVYPMAETGYRNALVYAPADFRWVYYLAWIAHYDGRAETALERFDAAARIRPDYPPLGLRRAQMLLDLARIDEAEPLFRAALGVPGLEAGAEYGLGQIALLRRDNAAAAEHLARALEHDPQAGRVHYPLAQALIALGRREEAKAHLQAPRHGEPRVVDEFVDELEALGRQARTHFIDAMRAVSERRFADAVAAFDRGLGVEPANANARVSLARAAYLTGSEDRARAELAKVASEHPDHALALFLLGVLVDVDGDTAAAEAHYRAALAAEPDHAGANFALAGLAMQRGDFAAAIGYDRVAIEADPDNLPARLELISALANSGASESAIDAELALAESRRIKGPQLRYARAWLQATATEPRLRDPAAAETTATEIARTVPVPSVHELLAYARAAQGKFDSAREALGPVVQMALWKADYALAERAARWDAAFQSGTLPELKPLSASDPLLARPRLNPTIIMREYPTARAH